MNRFCWPQLMKCRINKQNLISFNFSTVNRSSKKILSSEDNSFLHYGGIVLFSSLIGGTFALGIWQTNRYFWKIDLIEQRKTQLSTLPKKCPENLTYISKECDELRFQPIELEGTFDADKLFFLGPRSPPIDTSNSNPGIPKSGSYILMPFRRTNGSYVIVNRGWIPSELVQSWKWNADRNVQQITVIISQQENPNRFTPSNDIRSNSIFYIDLKSLAKSMGIPQELPLLVDEIELENTTKKLPQRKTLSSFMEFYVTPWKHAVYACTWFSLAIGASLLTFLRFRRRKVKQVFPLTSRQHN